MFIYCEPATADNRVLEVKTKIPKFRDFSSTRDDKQNVASLHFACRARGCHGVNEMSSVNSVHVRHFVYPEPVRCNCFLLGGDNWR